MLADHCIYVDHVPCSPYDQHAGVQGFNGLIDTQEGHQVTVTGLDKLRSSPLASVLSRGLNARSVEHSPLGTSFSCSNACMEQLLKVLLASNSPRTLKHAYVLLLSTHVLPIYLAVG